MNNYVKDVITTIEERLFDEFSIEELPHQFHISAMQLYRDFHSATGFSIKEYIRRRKLSYALQLIKYSDVSLAEIAYESGYSSQQAMCRVVKKYTDLTPLQFKNSDLHFYFPRFQTDSLRQIKVETETIPETIELHYYSSKLKDIEHRGFDSLLKTIPDYKGRIFGRDGQQMGSKFCYKFYLETDKVDTACLLDSEFYISKVIPSDTCIFAKTTVHSTEDIYTAWDYLYSKWLTKSMFHQTDQPYFEEYLHRNHLIKKLELYIPVEKKYDIHTIKIMTFEERLFLVAMEKGYKAEERSSRKVIDFINDYNPYLLCNATTFYIDKNECTTCGVEVDIKLTPPTKSGIQTIKKPAGRYAVYEGQCLPDSNLYKAQILKWAEENGFSLLIDHAFVVYTIDGDYDTKSIRTKVCVPLKDVRK